MDPGAVAQLSSQSRPGRVLPTSPWACVKECTHAPMKPKAPENYDPMHGFLLFRLTKKSKTASEIEICKNCAIQCMDFSKFARERQLGEQLRCDRLSHLSGLVSTKNSRGACGVQVTKSTAVVNLVPTLWLDGTAFTTEALIAPLSLSIPPALPLCDGLSVPREGNRSGK